MKVVFSWTRGLVSPGPLAIVCAIGALSLSGCSWRPPLARAVAPERSCTSACLAGLDPYDTGCASDAETSARAPAIDGAGKVVAVVELRRSARCETVWARAVRAAGAGGALVATVSAPGYSSSFEHPTDGEVWTDMVPAPRACAAATGGLRQHDGTTRGVRAASCDPAGGVSLASNQ